MPKPKISIIIPIFNAEKYIDECINSLEKQTLQDMEIICINDGSTDNTQEKLENHTDNKIKIYNQENSGPGKARNNAIIRVTGKYILFLDSDDWLEPNTLERLYNNAKTNNSDLVLFNAVEHLPDNKYHNRIYNLPENNYENFSFNYTYNKNLVMNSYQVVCTKLHKTSFIKENNIKFNENGQFEDVMFHIESMIKAKRISYVPDILYHYRKTEKNTRQKTAQLTKKSFYIFTIFKQTEQLLKTSNIYDELYINFIQFKITELENIYNNINENDKKELYGMIKDDFKKMKLTDKTLNQLPKKNRDFYNNIINSENHSNTTSSGTLKKIYGKIKHII